MCILERDENLIFLFCPQTELTDEIHDKGDTNLRSINSQLLLLEANLRRRQEELATVLRQKDLTIHNQQRLILALASAYTKVTGDKQIQELFANTSKDDPNVDFAQILKDILALSSQMEDVQKKVQTTNEDISMNNNTDDRTRRKNLQNETKKVKDSLVKNLDKKVTPIIEEETIVEEQLESNDTNAQTQVTKSDSDSFSVTDTDSAIMLEDTCSDSLVILPYMRDGVKVIRSVSDALECNSRPLQLPPNSEIDLASTTRGDSPPSSPISRQNCDKIPSNINARKSLSTTPSCSSGSEDSDASPSGTLNKARSSSIQTLQNLSLDESFDQENFEKTPLNRSLSDSSDAVNKKETSFSSTCPSLDSSFADEFDTMSSSSALYDSDSTLSEGTSDTEEDSILNFEETEDGTTNDLMELAPERRLLVGSFEKTGEQGLSGLCVYKKKPDEFFQVTYNRVMSNHRSVTKVKDVKYKRINKAKSRSLEELRGKLKTREGKPLISMSIGHSYA